MNHQVDVKPLRIALLTHSTLPRGGVVHALAVGDALADAGHHVRLLAPVQPGEALFRAPRSPRCRFIGVPATQVIRVEPMLPTHANQSLHSIGSDQAPLVRLVQRRIDDWMHYFDTVAEAFDADVFHAQDSISANALANLVEAGRLPGFVRTVHHLDVFANPQLAAWQQRGFRAAAHVCCVSEIWRDKLLCDEGIDAALVRNGVDRYRFSPEPDDGDAAVQALRDGSNTGCNDEGADACAEVRGERHTIAARHHAPIFLSVGGVEARKNTLNALAAYALWREHAGTTLDLASAQEADSDTDVDAYSDVESRAYLHRHHAQWWIAGGASLLDHRDYGQRFLSMAETAGLSVGRTLDSTADIVLLGRIDDTLMPALFRAADALLFPSLVEGFGLVVLEALSVGTPVITSRIAPFTEYLPEAAVEWADPMVPYSITAAMCRAVPVKHSSITARIASSAAANTHAANTHAGNAYAGNTHAADEHVLNERRRQTGFAVAEAFSWANSASQHSDLYRRWQGCRPLAVVREARAEVPDVPADTASIVPRTVVSEQASHHA